MSDSTPTASFRFLPQVVKKAENIDLLNEFFKLVK